MTFPVKRVTVATFNIIPFDDNHCGFLTWTCEGKQYVQNGIFDLTTGHEIKLDLLGLGLVTI